MYQWDHRNRLVHAYEPNNPSSAGHLVATPQARYQYRYVGNDPTGYTDPSGLSARDVLPDAPTRGGIFGGFSQSAFRPSEAGILNNQQPTSFPLVVSAPQFSGTTHQEGRRRVLSQLGQVVTSDDANLAVRGLAAVGYGVAYADGLLEGLGNLPIRVGGQIDAATRSGYFAATQPRAAAELVSQTVVTAGNFATSTAYALRDDFRGTAGRGLSALGSATGRFLSDPVAVGGFAGETALGGAFGRAFSSTRTAARTLAPRGTVPHGFFSADEFANFGDELRAGLRGIGIDDAQGILQGSSVTGVRRFSKPGIPAGTPFDAIRRSDFDVAISSPQLLRRADSLAIPLRGRGTRSQPLGPLDLDALGLQNLPGNLSQRLFNSNGRDINFIITNSAETAFSRGPSIRVPTR